MFSRIPRSLSFILLRFRLNLSFRLVLSVSRFWMGGSGGGGGGGGSKRNINSESLHLRQEDATHGRKKSYSHAWLLSLSSPQTLGNDVERHENIFFSSWLIK
jgi:hypothetical protein